MKIHLSGLLMLCLMAAVAQAQELEPRALTKVPVGMNFAMVGYGYAGGNILLDPALPIEDLNAKLHTVIAAYLRSISLFGRSAKVDAVVPFAGGDWSGLYEGVDTTTARTGFGDPRLRLSMNFTGAPALTTVGAIVQVIVPLGQYDPTKLINLGSNRWTFRLQLGVAHTLGKWILEGYLGGWFFMKNTNFFNGLTVEQRPLVTAKVHLIRTMRKGRWLALGAGYGIGGRSIVEGNLRDTRISAFRFALTLAQPVGQRHTLRFTVISGVRLERGPDFDALALSYQYRWGGR